MFLLFLIVLVSIQHTHYYRLQKSRRNYQARSVALPLKMLTLIFLESNSEIENVKCPVQKNEKFLELEDDPNIWQEKLQMHGKPLQIA